MEFLNVSYWSSCLHATMEISYANCFTVYIEIREDASGNLCIYEKQAIILLTSMVSWILEQMKQAIRYKKKKSYCFVNAQVVENPTLLPDALFLF